MGRKEIVLLFFWLMSVQLTFTIVVHFAVSNINVWNTLPVDRVDFFAAFKRTLQQIDLSMLSSCY